MPLVFTPDRIREIRQHARQTHATLVMRSESYRAHRLYFVYREWIAHDEDGNATGKQRAQVSEDGQIRTRATVLAQEDINVYDNTDAFGRRLDQDDARGCGYKSVMALRSAWKTKHPQAQLARIVWFAFGDWRDVDVFMQYTGRVGGDYTRNRHRALDPDAPALTSDQYSHLGMVASQANAKRRDDAAKRMAAQSLGARMQAIELAGNAVRANLHITLRREFHVIEERVSRAERAARDLGLL